MVDGKPQRFVGPLKVASSPEIEYDPAVGSRDDEVLSVGLDRDRGGLFHTADAAQRLGQQEEKKWDGRRSLQRGAVRSFGGAPVAVQWIEKEERRSRSGLARVEAQGLGRGRTASRSPAPAAAEPARTRFSPA